MINPIPYDQYGKGDVRALLDALPLDAVGRRVGVGMDVSTIVQVDRHTRAMTVLTSRVTAVSDDGRLFFDPMTAGAIEDLRHGIRASRCWVDRDLAYAEFAERKGRLDKTG